MNIKGRDIMTLQEILKRKLSQSSKEDEKKEEPEIEYQAVTSFSTPTPELFLAVYTPFIKNPYHFDWFIFREYSSHILDGTYVLNTFPVMDKDNILQLYLERMSPKSFEEYAKLVHFVGHLCLCVPASYEIKIKEIIEKI